MKKYIRSNSYEDTRYNISWYSQDGSQNGGNVLVPAEEMYDPYSYIEHYLINTYGDEYGGIADYIECCDSVKAMTEDELDIAINEGRPFTLEDFNKYKVDPYRAKGAVKADVLEVGDIIQVTEDAAEIDCPSPEIEIMNIDTSDPDGYGHDCITFYCYDNETGDEYTLHFWPDEWVGPVIAKKSKYAQDVTSASEIADDNDEWNPYSDGTYRIDGRFVKYSNVPVTAITTWFKMQKDAWSDVCIMCRYRKDAIKLLEQATPELLEELNERYEQPYKLDYLIDEVRKQLDNGCRSFYEGDYGYGDSIHPFSVG